MKKLIKLYFKALVFDTKFTMIENFVFSFFWLSLIVYFLFFK